MCGAFKAQGFSWPFPRVVFHIDNAEVTPPWCSLKDFQNISLTTCGPLPMTYPAAGSSTVAFTAVQQPNYMKYSAPMTDFPALAPCWLHKQNLEMKAVCHTTSLQDADTAVSCARRRKSRSQGRSPQDWAMFARRNAFWQAPLFHRQVCMLISGVEGFLQSRRQGKTPPVLWMLLASFWPLLSPPPGVKPGWRPALPLSFHISN